MVLDVPQCCSRLMQTSLDKDGVAIVTDFLSAAEVSALRREVEDKCSNLTINGRLGVTRLRRDYVRMTQASLSIRSVNLLEVALKVHDYLDAHSEDFRGKKYRLSNIEIFKEERSNNDLFWHTDERFGMIRAQIYIQGGQADSGAFWYMRGTHRRDFYVVHKIDSEQQQQFAGQILECVAPEGSLVAFDAFGFHAKAKCRQPRISMMFEFQHDSASYYPPGLVFSVHNLTQAVLDRLDVFTLADTKQSYNDYNFDGTEYPLSVGATLRLVKVALWDVLKNYLVAHRRKLMALIRSERPSPSKQLPEAELEKRQGYSQWRDWLRQQAVVGSDSGLL